MSGGRQEQLGTGGSASNGEPGADGVADFLPQEQSALLTAFTEHADLDVAPVEAHAVQAQPDELGHTEPAGETEVEHGAVANAEARRWVRRVENGARLRGRQVLHETGVGALRRNGEHAANLIER